MVGIVLDGGGEQRVDEGGLSESRLAGNLQGSRVSVGWRVCDARLFGRGIGRRTIIVKAAPLFATILCRWLGKLAMSMRDEESVAIVEVELGVFPGAIATIGKIYQRMLGWKPIGQARVDADGDVVLGWWRLR